MGTGRFNYSDWKSYAKDTVSKAKSAADIYTSRSIVDELDPKNIKMREPCDSPSNPNSTPIIIGLDETGSMGCIAESMARDGLVTLATEIYDRKPVPDPHIMFMGIGDVHAGDRAPLQVTQFEADIRIAKQLAKIYLEGRGGGNSFEGYILAWYFASMHTRIDSFEKRNKKGFLFTIGDEEPTPNLLASHIERVFGYNPQFKELSAEQLLTMVSRQYEVFHLIVEEGHHMRYGREEVIRKWRNLLGQRAILLSDYKKMSEVIVSTLQVVNGANTDTVISSWDGSTALVVEKAIKALNNNAKSSDGIVRF